MRKIKNRLLQKLGMNQLSPKYQKYEGNLRKIFSETKTSYQCSTPHKVMTKAKTNKNKFKFDPAALPNIKLKQSAIIKENEKEKNYLNLSMKERDQEEEKKITESLRYQKNFEYFDISMQNKIREQKREVQRNKKRLKTVLDRYQQNHNPSNASNSASLDASEKDVWNSANNAASFQRPKSQVLLKNSSPSPQKSLHLAENHLTYEELVEKRKKDEQNSRIIILRKVIFENVKKKNKELLLNGKKKIKSILS